MTSFISIENANAPIRNPARVRKCESFGCRLRGLMFVSRLGPNEGLLLIMPRESRVDAAIHMLFVRFDLAIFWINSNMEIVDKTLARSWHPAYVPASPARYVLEVHPDRFSEYEIGQKVEFVHA